MEMSQSHHHKAIAQRGFTMVEVLFAMIILAVGMIALSSLAAQTMAGTAQSRFMGLSASLVSEKLEDLNRWPTWDPHVCVASGTTAGAAFGKAGTTTTQERIVFETGVMF